MSSRRPMTALSAVTMDTLTGTRVKFYWALHHPMDAIVTSLLGVELLGGASFLYERGWLEHGLHQQTVDFAVELHEVRSQRCVSCRVALGRRLTCVDVRVVCLSPVCSGNWRSSAWRRT